MTEYLYFKGKKYKKYRSSRKGKKFFVKVNEKKVHFGATGYRTFPGTRRGDNYCARSSGIKSKKPKKFSSNFWARQDWNCKGKVSVRASRRAKAYTRKKPRKRKGR